MARRAWQVTVHGVAKSQTQLKQFSICVCMVCGFPLAGCGGGNSNVSLLVPMSQESMCLAQPKVTIFCLVGSLVPVK